MEIKLKKFGAPPLFVEVPISPEYREFLRQYIADRLLFEREHYRVQYLCAFEREPDEWPDWLTFKS